jgi:hypothetical protein
MQDLVHRWSYVVGGCNTAPSPRAANTVAGSSERVGNRCAFPARGCPRFSCTSTAEPTYGAQVGSMLTP